jgi:uncharacterized DUF497 family protein
MSPSTTFRSRKAATVFGDPLGLIVADPRHSSVEERLVLLGFSEDRRLRAVMYVELNRRDSDRKCAQGHTPGAKKL